MSIVDCAIQARFAELVAEREQALGPPAHRLQIVVQRAPFDDAGVELVHGSVGGRKRCHGADGRARL